MNWPPPPIVVLPLEHVDPDDAPDMGGLPAPANPFDGMPMIATSHPTPATVLEAVPDPAGGDAAPEPAGSETATAQLTLDLAE